MLYNEGKTNVTWITSQRFDGGEWATYTKKFVAKSNIDEAVFRFENDCVCAVYINGEFITSGTGRLPERVVCHEVTSKLCRGENVIELVLGGPYFQGEGFAIKEQRGYWLNSVAFELCVKYSDGSTQLVPTDDSWSGFADGKPAEVIESMRVTDAEYDMFWKNAAVWMEIGLHKEPIAPEIVRVVGNEYFEYATAHEPEYAFPVKIIETNMTEKNGTYSFSDTHQNEPPYIVYDFGKLVVGFTEISYKAESDVNVRLYHDFTERATDFAENADWRTYIDKLSVTQKLDAGSTDALVLRRRAFRFLKLRFDSDNIALDSVKVKLCMFPAPKQGWFTCNDSILTKAWNVGKYTLHVNKHQEYESCPRNEMEFFSGDGAIDALVDLYAFGEDELMNASLSIKEDIRCGGIAFAPKFNKSTIQWDYFAWRIICIYIHFKAHGDTDFLKRYFDEGENALLWQLERRNKFGLIFQKPCFVSTFSYALGQTEWTCSPHRLGEKVALNVLLYESLVAMSEMAAAIGESEKASEWNRLAEETKKAINERLWSEEKQCYMDSLDSFIAQDGNVLAVLFKVADGERAKQVLSTVKKELWSPYGSALLNEYVSHVRDGNKTVSPLMDAYECIALFENGMPEAGLDLIRRCWGTMIKKGAETFWEFAPNDSAGRWDIPSHAWSSGCTYLLSKYVMGIKAVSPDFGSVMFEPNVCDLTSIKGVVPTKHGLIAVAFEKCEKDGQPTNKFTLAVPKSVKLEYRLPENSDISIMTY